MNALSALSIIIYTAFFIGAGRVITSQRKGILSLSAFAVLLSLGWWSFCNSFFFAATTQSEAWFWHRLSSIGWCGFVALTAYYFFVLTDYRRNAVWWQSALFFTPPLVLICKNLFGKTTSLALDIIPSANGWGWTYYNSITSVWLWIYLLYVALYFGFAFYLLYQWSNSVKHKMKKEMAILFIVLDAITILLGVVTDVILPLTTPVLPAMASIMTAVFGLGYFGVIYRYDVFNINLVISPDDILQTSNNSIFVIDENSEILKYNRAAGSLLGYSKSELIGADFAALTVLPSGFHPPDSAEDLTDIEVQMQCKDGTIKDVLLSSSVAKDKHHSFLCIIVSCLDVSKQKRVQVELALEREKYKQLASDYQQLAYYDPLTGLPNRRHFFDTLSLFQRRYETEQQDFAVIFLDLDNFKCANDVYGHGGGDQLLKLAAQKLASCTEHGEFVARLGGDEFIMVIPYSLADCVDCKLEKIRAEFRRPVSVSGQSYEIQLSAGYSIFSQAEDTVKLMQRADEAMYGNKKGLQKNENFPAAP